MENSFCWWCYDEQESAEAAREIDELLAAPVSVTCNRCESPAAFAYYGEIRGAAPKYTYTFDVVCEEHFPPNSRQSPYYVVVDGMWEKHLAEVVSADPRPEPAVRRGIWRRGRGRHAR